MHLFWYQLGDADTSSKWGFHLSIPFRGSSQMPLPPFLTPHPTPDSGAPSVKSHLARAGAPLLYSLSISGCTAVTVSMSLSPPRLCALCLLGAYPRACHLAGVQCFFMTVTSPSAPGRTAALPADTPARPAVLSCPSLSTYLPLSHGVRKDFSLDLTQS